MLLNYEQPFSRPSFEALQRQLEHLLQRVGLRLDIRERKEATPHEQFAELFLFDMKGHCSMDPLPIAASLGKRQALAMAYTADGNILPFGAIECDRVRESLENIVGRGSAGSYQATFGEALALVMAHEIYHMLAHSPAHTRRGVTKESLSGRELLEKEISFPEAARLAMLQHEHESIGRSNRSSPGEQDSVLTFSP